MKEKDLSDRNEPVDIKQLKDNATRGDPKAQLQLGQLYSTGDGIETDYEKAVNFFREAQKHESTRVIAIYCLAQMYQYGLGVTQNYAEAVSRYRQIEQKHFGAKYRLGQLYEKGLGVEKNIEEARLLYRVASKKIPSASEALKRLSSLTAHDKNTEDSQNVANPPRVPFINKIDPMAAVAVNVDAKPQTCEQFSQPNTSATESTKPSITPSVSESKPTGSIGQDDMHVQDVELHRGQEETTAVDKKPTDTTPMVQLLGLEVQPIEITPLNSESEDPAKVADTSSRAIQWEYHEPKPGALWPKEHAACKSSINNQDVDIFFSRRRGRSHEHDGKFCDDDGDFWRHQSGWTVLAVADGAGSAGYSREGSRIAVATVLKEFKQWFTPEQVTQCDDCLKNWEDRHGEFHQYFYRQFFEICKKAITEIKKLAEDHNFEARQFATTLLVTVSKNLAGKTYLASLWIGDGAMVAYRPGASRLLGNADSGEFIGQTRFLDANYLQNHYPSSVSIAALDNVEALVLMTDGVSDPKFKSDADLSDALCWDRLWQQMVPVLAQEYPEQALLEWLHFFERGYHDDRTILISRMQGIQAQGYK